MNPLETGAKIRITIPEQFNIDGDLQVTTLGANLVSTPVTTLDVASRILFIDSVNTGYLSSFEFIYIQITGIKNPG